MKCALCIGIGVLCRLLRTNTELMQQGVFSCALFIGRRAATILFSSVVLKPLYTQLFDYGIIIINYECGIIVP